MKEIELTQGKVSLVDDDLFDYLNQFNWCAHFDSHNWYAIRRSSVKDDPNGKSFTMSLHHLVIGITRLPRILGLETDHIDGNGLNNQRSNLRIVPTRKNSQNREIHRNGKLVGAIFSNDQFRNKPWMTRITINGKAKNLGYFKTEEDAHNVYLNALDQYNTTGIIGVVEQDNTWKSSNYKGVSWDKINNKWKVAIYINGKYKFLGRFLDELEAHEAYMEAAQKKP